MSLFWLYMSIWIAAIIFHALTDEESAYDTVTRIGIAFILIELSSLPR